MTRAVLYARVSSEEQAEKDLSIPSQLKSLRKHCSHEGWEIIREFTDPGISARTTNRPGFMEMVSLARRKPRPFEIILVWKFSRFARNQEDSVVYKSLLAKLGIRVISLNEKTDDSPTGRLLESMIEAMDEFYSRNLAQDTKRGMKEAAQRGFFYGGYVPFGYKIIKVKDGGNDRSKLDIDPINAPTVKRIFQLFLAGHGGVEISKTLNKAGTFKRSGKPWGNTDVYHILNNPTYVGDSIYNRSGKDKGIEPIVTPNTHPSLISREEFNSIRGMLKKRNPKNYNPKSFSSPFLFSSLTRCSLCGAVLTASSGKSGQFHYYACTTRLHKGKGACASKPVPKEKFENAVIECLKQDVLTKANLTELVIQVNAGYREESIIRAEEKTGLEKKMAELMTRRKKLYEALETDQVQAKEVGPRLRELSDEIDALKGKLDAMEGPQAAQLAVSAERIQSLVGDMHALLSRSSLMESKAFLHTFIKRVNINYPHVEIEYSIPLKNTEAEPHKEVLLLFRSGSPGWIRTNNPPINSRMLHH